MSFCSAEPSCMCRDSVMTGTVLRTDRFSMHSKIAQDDSSRGNCSAE